MTKRIVASVLSAIFFVFAFAACDNSSDIASSDAESAMEEIIEFQPIDLADAVTHDNYASVYDMIGQAVTIDMVEEDEETGLAYVTVDGTRYELGMDFLSAAMVYNTDGKESVFNQWWKLYVQRWNYLSPEIPIYSDRHFDIYNAKLENFATAPYWTAADAIIGAKVKEGAENSVVLGSSNELTGAFRKSKWGKSSSVSSDYDIENLVSGYATVQTDKTGNMIWNMSALAEEPISALNQDGTLTFTIRIKEGLVFSDGSPITAKNYVAYLLANSTSVLSKNGGTGTAGQLNTGYEAFNAYDGTNDGAIIGEGDDKITVSRYFDGVKLLDHYTFSVTFVEDYANYHYVMSYAAYRPEPTALYLGDNYIVIDPTTRACGLSDGFYEKVQKNGKDVYAIDETIEKNLRWDSGLPYAGPYTVKNYDESTHTAILELNPYYLGDDARGKASVQTITYIKLDPETQMQKFQNGEIDVLSGIVGAAEIEEALSVVNSDPEKYRENHYNRAAYGKIGFRCDLGPTNFAEVRQAISYTIDRTRIAETVTGGYGGIVHGPYYEDYTAYQAVKDDIKLNPYDYSKERAIEVLTEGGWVYNANGGTFDPSVDSVRYKKLSGYELSDRNLCYSTEDGRYKTLKINGEYYMPLAINYYGTRNNEVTDVIVEAWQSNPVATTDIGAYIQYIDCDFNTGLHGEYHQNQDYGWDGVAKCTAINFATTFTSVIYDRYLCWTVNPTFYSDYSSNYLMDEADFYENYLTETPNA